MWPIGLAVAALILPLMALGALVIIGAVGFVAEQTFRTGRQMAGLPRLTKAEQAAIDRKEAHARIWRERPWAK